MIAAGIAMLIGLSVAVAQHVYWTGRVERANERADENGYDAMQWSRRTENWRDLYKTERDIRRKLEADLSTVRSESHDLTNLLVVERARCEIAEGELRRIAEQVKGKCLWPTLGDDDVVVDLAERRAR